MVFAALLCNILGARTPHDGILELMNQRLVESVAKRGYGVLRISLSLQNNWLVEVRYLALGLCIYANKLQVIPDFIEQTVKVPFLARRNRYIVWQAVVQLQLLHAYRVDLVYNVERGNVYAIAFNNVDQIVLGGVFSQHDVHRVYSILLADLHHAVIVQVSGLDCRCESNTSLVSLPDHDIWRLLVKSDPEPFKFVLNNTLMHSRLGCIQYNENQVAGACHGNDLLASTLAIFGTLDNSW
mmetsp:Transcript_20760/g.35743  ORF Transcript_20760/g.35743 Transcript_20760/m.35743 type:complete len:240 (+) Transcript_20760:130-849(+)